MDETIYPMQCGANDGGVKRGDRADTGDLEARHKEGVGVSGSSLPPNRGGGNVTGAADALAEVIDQGALEDEDVMEESSLDPLDAYEPDNPILGITNTEDRPPEDWAANTGPGASGVGNDAEVEELPNEPAPVPKPVAKAASQRKTGGRRTPK